jgi:hypothetical protein
VEKTDVSERIVEAVAELMRPLVIEMATMRTLILSKNVFTSEDWQAAREETITRLAR